MTTATLIARPSFALDTRHAVLRFERGPALALPQTRPAPPVVYRRAVDTLASQIRALAAKRGYDKLDNSTKIAVRNEIAEQLGASRQVVYATLSRKPKGTKAGAPRVHTDRCPCCEQALLTQSAHEAVARHHGRKRNR